MHKILLVEDEDTMRRLIGVLLRRKGFEVVEASGGEQGLELATQEQPDLILLDIMMPHVDGFETLRRLRANPETEDIPVIFLTAKSQVEDRVTGLHLGADDYIVKPADPDELAARIHAVLARTMRAPRRRRGQVFGFVGAKGGVGTSTVVANLGVQLQQNGHSVTLVDLHLAFGNLAELFNLVSPDRSTADLACHPPQELDEKILESTLLQHPSGIRILASPPRVPRELTFTPDHLTAILETAAHSARHILVDLPRDPDILEVVADQLNGVVLVVGTSPSSLAGAERMALHLGHVGLQDRLTLLLVEQSKADHQYFTSGDLSERIGCLVLGDLPYKPALYARAEYQRTPLLLLESEVADRDLYAAVVDKLLHYTAILDEFHKEQLFKSEYLN